MKDGINTVHKRINFFGIWLIEWMNKMPQRRIDHRININ